MRTATLLDPWYRASHMSAADLDYIRCQLEDEIVLFCKRDTPRPPVRVQADSTVVLTPEQRAHTEMANYLQEEIADGETNALEWWRGNESRFPLMEKWHRNICAFPRPAHLQSAFSVKRGML